MPSLQLRTSIQCNVYHKTEHRYVEFEFPAARSFRVAVLRDVTPRTLFVCCISNEAVSTSDYAASSDWMTVRRLQNGVVAFPILGVS
jgi:hypothetical protein